DPDASLWNNTFRYQKHGDDSKVTVYSFPGGRVESRTKSYGHNFRDIREFDLGWYEEEYGEPLLLGSVEVYYLDEWGLILNKKTFNGLPLGTHTEHAIEFEGYKLIDDKTKSVEITKDDLKHEITFIYKEVEEEDGIASISLETKDYTVKANELFEIETKITNTDSDTLKDLELRIFVDHKDSGENAFTDYMMIEELPVGETHVQLSPIMLEEGEYTLRTEVYEIPYSLPPMVLLSTFNASSNNSDEPILIAKA